MKEILVAANGLGIAEEHCAVRLQGKMKEGEDATLGLDLEIDQEVAAGDEIDLGKRRVADQVLFGKGDRLPNPLLDPVAVALSVEKFTEPFLGDVGLDAGRVDAGSCLLQDLGVDIGGEDLQAVGVFLAAPQFFEDEDGDGVGLLAGGGPGHPDPDRGVRQGPVAEGGDDLGCEQGEGLLVAEKTGHHDQEILGQFGKLLGVILEEFGVGLDVWQAQEIDASFDPAAQGAELVAAEIVAHLLTEDIENFVNDEFGFA